jgi:putative oxidoreductase
MRQVFWAGRLGRRCLSDVRPWRSRDHAGPLAHPLQQGRTNKVNDSIAITWAPRLLSVLRIVAALIFLEHGTQKLFGFPPRASGAGPELFTLIWFAGAMEVVGGILLLIGWLTRPVAFILSGEMAFAYFIGHAPRNFFPVLNGGDAAILYCFVFLYIAAAGPGPWSIDAGRRR